MARDAGKPDLVPLGMFEGDCRIERHVPLLPYAREVAAFERLKQQLATYRVVFGQPRQEELLMLPDQSAVTLTELQELAIDLSPPECVGQPLRKLQRRRLRLTASGEFPVDRFHGLRALNPRI